MSSVTWAPKHRPGFINKNEVYCFFIATSPLNLNTNFARKKKQNKTLWYKPKRSQVRRNTMVFFRSYDRLSHKDARRGITGPSCRFMHKKDEVFFLSMSSLFYAWTDMKARFVRFWSSFGWDLHGNYVAMSLWSFRVVFTVSDIFLFTRH